MVCNNSCTPFAPQVVIPVPWSGASSPYPISPFTGGSAPQVNDTPISTLHKVIGIAIGPQTPAQYIASNSSPVPYSAGQTLQVAISGIAYCQFDNQVADGDYVVVSSENIGFCSSVGSTYPENYTDGEILGIAQLTNSNGSYGWPAAVPVLLSGGLAAQ
jgi:hypothetical protein